ncbi:MAG: S8 family serine peptidase [Crocinitomicaceae bacterium]
MKGLLLLTILLLPFKAMLQNNYVPGELIVQFSTHVNAKEQIRTFSSSNNIHVENTKLISKNVNIYLITFSDSLVDLNKCRKLFYDLPDVINAQLNHYVHIRETIPTDTIFGDLWHLKNTGQSGGTIDADIDATDAWDITTGGLTTHNDTIVACVIESQGVDITHVDLKDNIWHNYAEIPDDGIDNDGNGYIDDFDGWNVDTEDDQVGFGTHGTRVAGMLGAKGNNTTGISGVNWDVKMMIIKGQNVNVESSVIEAYDYPLTMRKLYNSTAGQEGAFVVVTNASFGIDGGVPADAPIWCAMYDSLGTHGILNICAATNQNTDVDINGDLPTTCPSNYLIAVTMTNNTDVRAGSGYGTTHVDLGAPGAAVKLTSPTNLYSSANGTSFASPCVAGAVALAYSTPCTEFIDFAKTDPSGAALAMRNYILNNVDPITALATEVASGGRLNVNNTINDILGQCNTSLCVPPYHLRSELITDTTAHLVWQGFSTQYLFYIQENSGPLVQIPVTNEDTIYFDTLIPCANYTTYVKEICGLDTSDFSVPYSFKTDGCCDNPDLILEDVSADSILISWNSVLYATQYDFRYRKVGDVSWIATLTDTISPIQLSGLDTCTSYEFQIKTICTDSTHGFSTSFVFSTKGCGACFEEVYCDINGASTSSEWIEAVVIDGYYSTTGNNGGWYQTQNLMAGFIPGQTYNVALTPGYSGFNFTEHFSIWVDLDQNGIFDATDEVVANQTSNTVLNTTITIPVTAVHGYTKMRIGMNGEDPPLACQSASFYGEYEDYCAYIGLDAGIESQEMSVSIYPNPATNSLHISSAATDEKYSIYSQDGKLILSVPVKTEVIDISSLSVGFYVIVIENTQGRSVQKFIKQ